MRKLDPAKIISLGAMCAALSVLSLYASAVLPTAKLAFYFLSSVFVYMLTAEEAYAGALISFLASALLSFVLLPDKLYLAPYVALLGHYGIFRTWLDRRLGDRLLGFLLRMLYCNLATAAGILSAVYVFQFDLAAFGALLPFPSWVAIPALEAGFALFDFLYWICQKIYEERIRTYLVPRR